jgi:hypothetical protein
MHKFACTQKRSHTITKIKDNINMDNTIAVSITNY